MWVSGQRFLVQANGIERVLDDHAHAGLRGLPIARQNSFHHRLVRGKIGGVRTPRVEKAPGKTP